MTECGLITLPFERIPVNPLQRPFVHPKLPTSLNIQDSSITVQHIISFQPTPPFGNPNYFTSSYESSYCPIPPCFSFHYPVVMDTRTTSPYVLFYACNIAIKSASNSMTPSILSQSIYLYSLPLSLAPFAVCTCRPSLLTLLLQQLCALCVDDRSLRRPSYGKVNCIRAHSHTHTHRALVVWNCTCNIFELWLWWQWPSVWLSGWIQTCSSW